MRTVVWVLTSIFVFIAIYVYVQQKRAVAEIETRSIKLQVEVDKVLQDFKDARTMVCDGVCPKG